ncbi:hypothetical protein IFM89_027007, partial [Coptis chinensis]
WVYEGVIDDPYEEFFIAENKSLQKFFTTKPYPCDPSTLPKYPPKATEFDTKLRDEEARRAASVQGRESEYGRRDSRNSNAAADPNVNAELQISLQKRQPQSNPKSNSEKYNPQEDDGSGFPIDPPRGPSAYGSSWNKKGIESGHVGLRTQRSYMPMPNGAFEHSGLASRNSALFNNPGERNSHSQWVDKQLSSKYNQLDDAEPSGKQEWNNHLLDRPASSHKKGDKGYGPPKKNRIHYSGPLMPPGGNLDEMLKEHERQIQQAVRKACLDKVKTKKNIGDGIQSEALLY